MSEAYVNERKLSIVSCLECRFKEKYERTSVKDPHDRFVFACTEKDRLIPIKDGRIPSIPIPEWCPLPK